MNKKIIVIGAGAAGIAATSRLLENGFKNIIILEAENRIGGRIHTIPFADNVVDMGAQWCHGEKGNVSYGLAENKNLLSSSTVHYDSFLLIQSDGNAVQQDHSDSLMNLAINLVESYKDEMKVYEGSLGDWLTKKYTEAIQVAEYKTINPELTTKFLKFFHNYENSIEASDTWFETSCSGYCDYWDCEGDRLLNWKDRGYKTVLDLLMQNVSKDLVTEKCLLNKQVTKICWNKTDSEFATVRCSDGSIYDADHIISTASIGVLKENHLQWFDPPLPPFKINAINGLTLGTVDKIYLEFENSFWPENWDGFGLIWNQTELDSIRQSENDWLEDIVGFFTVDYQPRILCGWISGVNARRMEMEAIDDVRDGCMKLLRMFLKDWDIPNPTRIERTTWFKNPNFRGSYTFKSLKTDMLNTSPKHLSQPLTNVYGAPVLQFAGEATHDHFYSTVHGAIESGWRESERIIDLYNTKKSGQQPELTCSIISEFTERNCYYTDVLILGAGLAGLGAAYKIKNFSQLRYLVLEGQNKAGGRVNTMNMLSNPVILNEDTSTLPTHTVLIDSGAQWLHGKYNLLHEIVQNHDLLSYVQSEEGLGSYRMEDASECDPFFVRKIDFLVGRIFEKCEIYASGQSDNYPKSAEQFLRNEFDKHLKSMSTQEQILAKRLLDWHIRFQMIDNSCNSFDSVSAKCWGNYSFNGEDGQAHYNFKNGFSDAVEAIVNKLDRNQILLNKEIVKIEIDPNTDELCKVTIQCLDGTIYYGRHVIVTFSIGVLRSLHDRLFSPPLPSFHRNAIENIGFDTINKIFLQFESPWWEPMTGIQLLFTNNEYKHWTDYISGFDILNSGPTNTLLAWIGGTGAIEMEKLNDRQIINDCLELLRKFTNLNVSEPIRYFCTRWNSNRFVQGAYSYLSTNCDNICPNFDALKLPITSKDYKTNSTAQILRINHISLINDNIKKFERDSPIILFAGEACHQEYFSTAHGAFLSGIEQAEIILNHYMIAEK